MDNINNESNQKPTPKYWMSLEQWRQDPEFLEFAEKEFRTSPLQSSDGEGGWARREFLKLMGASLALSTFGCVRRPAQKIVPYAKKPPEIQHGFPNYYASSFVDGYEALGILVTTRDGRPIKIEGNPDHPANAGGMSLRAHASILKLYDPDRYTAAKHNLQNKKRTNREIINIKWEDLDKQVSEQLAKGKVAILTANTMSPTTNALMDEFASAFGGKVYQYNDVGYDSLIEANKASYGSASIPRYHVEKAKVIVAINNDFLGTWLTPTAFTREFALRRKKTDDMNKLVVFESVMTLTGTNADRRYRIRPSQSLDVVMAILNELIAVKKVSRYAGDANVVRSLSLFSKSHSELPFNVSEVAEELWAARGASLVLAGDTHGDTEDALALNVAVNLLNAVLENDGKTVDASGAVYAAKGANQGIGELLTALKNKEVKTLIIHGCNPAYSLPASAQFTELLGNVEMVISTSDRNDETAKLADFVATDHHPLENWGDVQSRAGTISIQQPTIQPLYDTRAFQDSMIAWMKALNKGSAKTKAAASWYEYLQSSWKSLAKGNFDDWWSDVLQKGVVQTSAGGGGRSFASSSLSNVKPSARKTGFELALYTNVGVRDGSMANVPWLQEFPDPISKVCWDNYASFSIADAKQLKLKDGRTVTLTVGDKKVSVPAHIQPGQADGVIGLQLGYGRDGAGRVADGVGVNAYQLAQWSNGRRVTSGIPVSVSVNSDRYELAITQGHHTMEGRQIVVEETLKDHIKKPGGKIHRHEGMEKLAMWGDHQYNGNKWGMVIDLNSCTGCGACVIACQSENNIPTVGRKYVIDGREMHWLRIDRYWVGTPEDPDTVHQPLPCMHCENAPCETVCPVIATVHSDEGTNDMIYNRCVGTRYCSNNCPYKVRRFNWFSYTDIVEPRQMALNPEVTVRFRGVMEKCTFCIHRIRSTKSHAKIEGRPLKTDEFTTACAQSCPTKAIVFGDLNDANAEVAKMFNQPKSYSLLEELNTKPRVRYQVKVRNTDALKGFDSHHEEGHHA
jgi:molybdopterin-containing oxidoreductase family iron-sulfur binding subunit